MKSPTMQLILAQFQPFFVFLGWSIAKKTITLLTGVNYFDFCTHIGPVLWNKTLFVNTTRRATYVHDSSLCYKLGLFEKQERVNTACFSVMYTYYAAKVKIHVINMGKTRR